jgi:hypothetical protein
MAVIDFKTSPFFSGRIIFVGILLAVLGLFVAVKSILAGILLFIVSVLIVTTHYRLRIDFAKKVYFDFVWFLGLKNGDQGKFDEIEYLFIKKSRVSQKMNHIVISSTIQNEIYDGYLKFSNGEKIHLLTKESKDVLLKKLKLISHKLNTRIIDYSEGEPKEI